MKIKMKKDNQDVDLVWAVLCEKSIVDGQSNQISLINVVESLSVGIQPKDNQEFPDNPKFNIPINYEIVTFWMNEGGKENSFDMMIRLIDPDGKELDTMKRTVEVKEGQIHIKFRMRINGFPANKSGKYFVEVAKSKGVEFETMTRIPMMVNLDLKK